jgi:phospholipid transport system substrate-binding protein
VNWRVRLRDGKYKVIDVMVEGISMGQTQRSEFSSVIRKNGGKVKGLLVELRKRLNGNV